MANSYFPLFTLEAFFPRSRSTKLIMWNPLFKSKDVKNVGFPRFDFTRVRYRVFVWNGFGVKYLTSFEFAVFIQTYPIDNPNSSSLNSLVLNLQRSYYFLLCLPLAYQKVSRLLSYLRVLPISWQLHYTHENLAYKKKKFWKLLYSTL